jgi:UDP-2,3-diacylglucosamine pyrophosphatase LpxH
MIATGQIFVIGDSHIGLSDGSEKAVVSWIDRFVQLQPRALYLNGDLFHYLIADDKWITSSVERVFARFRQLREGGVDVHYVEGNRDFFLKGSFVENSVTDIALEYAVDAGGKKYLITHGDLINDHDRAYRFWRFASKSALSRFGTHFIPRPIAKRFVDGVERKLSRSNFKHKMALPIATMKEFGRSRAAEGFTDIVLGHFHEKLVMPSDGVTITILPPWFEAGEAMAIDPATGDSQFVEI